MPDATQNLKLKITADTSQAAGMSGLKGFATAIAGLSAALYTAKQAYKNFIEPVIQYNKEIKDASESTGMAAEELSRFVQVGDDMGVEMGKITKALEMGTKNGFAPSIDALADLADKGNAMASTTERAAMYTKIFGRNWAELNPILEMGGKRIREMAAAQADGLVVTEEEIRKTEELRLGLDELNDNWLAIRNNLVLGVTPALIEATEKQNFWQAAAGLFAGTADDNRAAASGWANVLREALVPAINGLAEAEQAATVDAALLLAAKEEMLNGQSLLWEYYMAEAARLQAEGEEVEALIEKYRRLMNMKRRGFTAAEQAVSGKQTGEHGGGGGEQEGYAFGGSVLGGGSYLVGEHGAERFTPGVGGSISSANDPLVQEIRRMVKTLPIVLRDAVQKA